MAIGYRSLTASSGIPISVTYDGKPEWKAGSVVIDWSTVAAVSGSPVTTNDQLTIPVGQKFLRYGQFMVQITATGLYGPYDPGASDGREAPVIGKCGVLNQTILETGVLNITTRDTAYRNLITGGKVWYDRLIQSVAATHTLALGPTFAELKAALPRLEYAFA
jgi:hypothetical protein